MTDDFKSAADIEAQTPINTPAQPAGIPDPPHPRDLICDEAGKELIGFVNDWKRRHQLSTAEFLWIMSLPSQAYIRQLGMLERAAQERGVKSG